MMDNPSIRKSPVEMEERVDLGVLPGAPSQGSPEKWTELSMSCESQKGAKTFTSPQGIGVGIFGFEGSPPVSGENMEESVKDPKVGHLNF